jgi:hypothetical protein
MDSDRFDSLSRTISSRRVLGAAIAGTLGGLLGLGEAIAAPCPKGRKRCRKRCIPKKQCCTTGNCRPGATGRVCQRGRCVCPPARPKLCGGRCVPAAGCCTAAECPQGAICSVAGACVCPAGSSSCGARCALPEGASCVGRPSSDCCSGTCDFLVGGGTCASCVGRSCGSGNPCCPGVTCSQGFCGGCRPRATSCTPGGQPCCNSDCGPGGACLSAAGGRCRHDSDCRTCYLGGQCAGACASGVCQV